MTQDRALGTNRLLEALPLASGQSLVASGHLIAMQRGRILHQRGAAIAQVYFPVDGVVAVLDDDIDGESVGLAVVGTDGMVGMGALLTGWSLPGRAVVQVAGAALAVPAPVFRRLASTDTSLHHALMQHLQALMVQMAQTALCNRHHDILQQLCRWLLLSLDRQTGSDVVTTQTLIAQALGVRREGITVAVAMLAQLDAVRTTRGHVQVVKRHILEEQCCRCYSSVVADLKRLGL